MFRLFCFTILLTSLNSCANNTIQPKTKLEVKEVLLKWNNMTLNSFNGLLGLDSSSYVHDLYTTRLFSFKKNMSIGSEKQLTSGSLRYNFLNRLRESNQVSRDFYIIERRISGEKLRFINFVINVEHKHIDSMEVYELLEDNWEKKVISLNESIKAQSFTHSMVDFGRGVNPDDLIITRFEDYQPVDSKFYLVSTLKEHKNWHYLLSIYF